MKNLYIIAKPKCDYAMVNRFIDSICFKYKFNKLDSIVGQLEPDDIEKIYSDLLDAPFYPDLEKFMCGGNVTIYVLGAKNVNWDDITAMKKFFRTFMMCPDGTSANHIHIAENWEMNNKIGEVINDNENF